MSTEEDLTRIAVPDQARHDLEGLVARFARNLDVCTRPEQKQTQAALPAFPNLHKKLAAGWDRSPLGVTQPT